MFHICLSYGKSNRTLFCSYGRTVIAISDTPTVRIYTACTESLRPITKMYIYFNKTRLNGAKTKKKFLKIIEFLISPIVNVYTRPQAARRTVFKCLPNIACVTVASVTARVLSSSKSVGNTGGT